MISAKDKKWLLSTVLVLIVLAGGWWFYLKVFSPSEKLRLRRGDVVESIYGLGTVTADKVYHLRAGIVVSVRKILVSEGDLVRPGDPLIQLDENIMRSPIQGTVTSVAYKDGELVTPQVPVVTVTNLDRLFLEISLEQQSILRIKKGQTAIVSFESLRNEKYEGLVASVYPRDSQFIVRLELNKWPTGVLPGMTADVAVLVGKKTKVLLVPLRAIVGGEITRLREGRKERVPIKLGVIDGEWGELTSENIREDDEILIRK